jgi:hypothetical protein
MNHLFTVLLCAAASAATTSSCSRRLLCSRTSISFFSLPSGTSQRRPTSAALLALHFEQHLKGALSAIGFSLTRPRLPCTTNGDLCSLCSGSYFSFSQSQVMSHGLSLATIECLTRRWSERRTAVRSTFEMATTFSLRAKLALVRRRSSYSR